MQGWDYRLQHWNSSSQQVKTNINSICIYDMKKLIIRILMYDYNSVRSTLDIRK